MPGISTKNQPLSNAGASLGLGDDLQTQVEDEINERKKNMAKVNALTAVVPYTQSLTALGLTGGGATG